MEATSLTKFKNPDGRANIYQGFTERGAVAAELGVDISTIRRWDKFLGIYSLDYRASRLGKRMPLDDYQRWCMKKLKNLFQPAGRNKPLPKKAVAAIIKSQPEMFNYKGFAQS